MDLPTEIGRADPLGDLDEDLRAGIRIANVIDGIEPEPVETEVLEPVKRVLDEKAPDRRPVLGNCGTPRRLA